MRGDHPDPSVVKVGDTYWASATTSNWFPAYPLLYSKDLVNWKQKGYIFDQLPAWADYYFWAPEMTYENGKVYVYYAAHKKGGNLCVGIASADKPEGPYKDHGPIICQEVGSIDAFPMRDENGKLHIVWKEDANSVGKPTPIWASELNEERTALVGEKKELFRNDAPWEKNLVEGVSMIKHGEYYYAFYAAAGCCGATCSYLSGVARSKKLLGPWEKYQQNPVLTNTENWICPGHGTPVEKDGKYYFLYHGYDKKSNAFTGREGLLQEFTFTADGWVAFEKPNSTPIQRQASFTDEFKGRKLDQTWQWSVFQNIDQLKKGGRIKLSGLPTSTGAFLGQKTMSGDYNATTVINANKSDAASGIAAIGDEKNVVEALLKGNQLRVLEVKDGKETEIISKEIAAKKKVHLQVQVRDGYNISFLYSLDGKSFMPLNQKSVSGAYLPPWDRAVRVGIISKGSPTEKAVFDRFEMNSF
jgi:beta-xylosidase